MIIRLYQQGDEQQINALFHKVFGVKRSTDEWAWKFKSSDLVDSVIVVAEQDGKLVGHAGCLVFEGFFDGQPITYGLRVDVMVDPASRGQGVYSQVVEQLIETCEKRNIEIVYGFPAEKAKDVFIRVSGALDIGSITRYLSVQKSIAFPSHKPVSEKILKSWANNKPAVPARLSIGRDMAFFRYRYLSNPLRSYFAFEGSDGLVIYTKSRFKGVISYYFVLDCLGSDPVKTLREFSKFIGPGLVSAWATSGSRLGDAMEAIGWKPHSQPMPVVVQSSLPEVFTASLSDWHLTKADTDSF